MIDVDAETIEYTTELGITTTCVVHHFSPAECTDRIESGIIFATVLRDGRFEIA